MIAYFNKTEHTHQVAVELIDSLVKSGTNPAVISPVTAMELLIVPLRRGPGAVTTVHDFINNWPNLDLVRKTLAPIKDRIQITMLADYLVPDGGTAISV